MLAREGHNRLVWALALAQIVTDGVVVLDFPLDAAGHHHRSRLPADLAERQHLLVKVVHHDLGLQPDGVLVPLDVAAKFLPRLLGVELRVALHRLGKLVVTAHWRVVCEHIENKTLLDRLLHGVAVERQMFHLAIQLGRRSAENLERLVLGRSGEGKIAGVGQHLLGFH